MNKRIKKFESFVSDKKVEVQKDKKIGAESIKKKAPITLPDWGVY